MTSRRWMRFIAVGFLGLLLQLGALALLTSRAGWAWLPATLVSVELAVVHNFVWHARWTWSDRPGEWGACFVRFQLSNGLASLAGNAALMALFVGALGLPALPANLAAVTTMSVVTFVTADRWVFLRPERLRVAVVLWVACVMPTVAAAQVPETISAWDRYVAATVARLERSRTSIGLGEPPATAMAPSGASVHVPSGTISHWRGSMFIGGITLDRLLQRLQDPGTPPPQEDVVSSRVIARAGDSVRVSIRLTRRAVVRVTYDTEHEIRFHRWTPRLATARSVATRIAEVGGSDHGFLWRLHSYWRYEEIGGGALVELEALTLSRDVPPIVRPIAGPLVARLARESVERTLAALRRFLDATDPAEGPSP